MRHLVVVCPDWPVVASGSPVDLPVVVVAANRVVACSAAARAEGVETGLRRRQAEARCPGLVLVADDPARDARAFEPVVAAVEAFTPGVEILRPGVCAIATRGPSRYFGGDQALAAAVTAAVDEVLAGLGGHGDGVPRCRVGVADGRLAAGLAAHAVPAGHESVIVPPGESRAFLAPFPVATLHGELPELLVRLGIRTLGDLAALPMPAVLARFGTEGATACRRARGLDERPLAARTPPPDLAVTAELDPPADRADTIAFVARSLAEELHGALAERGLAATRLLVEAETDHGDTLARRWRHDGGLTAAAMAERVRWQLDGWLNDRPPADAGDAGDGSGGLVLLRLTPEEVGPDEGRQEGFWGGDRAAAERAGRAMARVQGVLGPASVVTASIGGGRGPAEQVRLVPWGDASPTGNTPDQPWPGRIPPPAPATVHPVPLAADVVDVDGRSVAVTGRATATAAPAWLSLAGGQPVEVEAWAGPWPVDERWWDPAAHRRRAGQIVTADGAAHLLVVEGGRWSVEATYD